MTRMQWTVIGVLAVSVFFIFCLFFSLMLTSLSRQNANQVRAVATELATEVLATMTETPMPTTTPTVSLVPTARLITMTPTVSVMTFTPTPTPSSTPTTTPKPQPTATKLPPTKTRLPPSATPQPTTKLKAPSDGAPPNPWGYNFTCCQLIYSPPSGFCSYFACIENFWNGVGYVIQCQDSMFSKSGGRSGSCSHHSGNGRKLYAP